jgi:hypothetical protein
MTEGKPNLYIFDENDNPVESDLLSWGRWMEETNRTVAKTKLPNGVLVSTVFLGIDHNFGSGKSVLWETMIFKGPEDKYQERYTSLAAAIEGHRRAVQRATEAEYEEILGEENENKRGNNC